MEQKTQIQLGRCDITGTALYSQAFATDDPRPDRPRLRLEFVNPGDKDTWVLAHEGALHLGNACAKEIPNLVAHHKVDLSEQEALEQSAALSLLARWVDASQRQDSG